MHINGIKTFKIQTASPAGENPTAPKAQTSEQELEEELNVLFGEGSAAPASVQDAYVIGKASAASAETAAIVGQLASMPPSLEEVLAANPNAQYRLDLVVKLYEDFGAKLDALIASYDEAIALLPTGTQLSDMKAKRDQALEAKSRNGQCLDAARAMYEKVTAEDMKELTYGKDLNNDGILGPREYGIGCVYDNGWHYFDLQTKTPIPRPIIDLDYPSQIFGNDAVRIIDKDAAAVSTNPNEYPVDLYLQLNQERIESVTDWTTEDRSNPLGNTINFVIPEALWVLRDGKKVTPLIDNAVDDTDPHLTVAEFVNDETGIHQDIANVDKSRYVQVQVAKVEVESDFSGNSIEVDGRTIEGQNTYICLRDKDGNVITRMRIEGFVSENLVPQGMLLDDGRVAVDASNVSFGLSGYLRASPVEIDCSGYVSWCHKVTDNFAEEMGIEAKTADMENKKAYQENISFFQDQNYVSWKYAHGDITHPYCDANKIDHPDTEEGGAAYGEFHDRFSYAEPDPTCDPLSCEQTGVFITDVNGVIDGSNQRDVVQFRGVNDLPEYWKGKDLPKPSEEIRKYTNIYHGGGGGDVVTGKEGDFMGEGISFAWFETGSDDTVAVQVMEGSGIGNPNADRFEDTFRDPKNFVFVEGAQDTYLRDSGELAQTLTTDNVHDYAPYFNNDAYYLHGTPHVANTDDEDIVGGSLDYSVNFWEEDLDFSEPENNTLNAIKGYYADDDFKVPEDAELEIEGTYSAQVQAELNGFFEEAYGTADDMYMEILSYLNE